jgi:hypothetical protein
VDVSAEECEDCNLAEYSYLCPKHRKSVAEMLDEEDGVGKLIYFTYFDNEDVCGASKVAAFTEVAEQIFEEGKRRGRLPQGQPPTEPTSKAWNLDARALLDMGATSVDAATVRGVLKELDELRAAAYDKMQETYEGPCITDADEDLERVLQRVDGKEE